MPAMAFDTIVRNWVLVLTYTIDWVIIVAIAGAGGGLNFVRPSHRAFSVLDLSISYPIKSEVSITTVFLVAGPGAALVILLVIAFFVPSRSLGSMKQPASFRLKAWELEKSLAGLGLALATSFFITQGTKQLFGKPRPNMLARCQPDLANISSHTVGGYGQDISMAWTLVDTSICTTTDTNTLDDGFRSFPSGHSSFSWAGLFYLTLFLCAKFNIVIPHLPLHRGLMKSTIQPFQRTNEFELQQRAGTTSAGTNTTRPLSPIRDDPLTIRDLAASPPNYLLVVAFIPIAVAIYISSTRYTDYYHFGFDIIAGSLLGIITAWFSFRWYHLPLGRGHGWAWGARSRERAFGIGVGIDGYVQQRPGGSGSSSYGGDLEAGAGRSM